MWFWRKKVVMSTLTESVIEVAFLIVLIVGIVVILSKFGDPFTYTQPWIDRFLERYDKLFCKTSVFIQTYYSRDWPLPEGCPSGVIKQTWLIIKDLESMQNIFTASKE